MAFIDLNKFYILNVNLNNKSCLSDNFYKQNTYLFYLLFVQKYKI